MFGLPSWNKKEKISVPPMDWWYNARNPLTPDMWKLERFKSQLLFVPDELMRGHSMFSLIEKVGEYRGKVFTADDDFILWKKDSGIESMAVPLQGAWQQPLLKGLRVNKEPMFPLSRICGELYKINPTSYFSELDNYKQNGLEFVRQRIDVLMPYRIQENSKFSTEQFLQPLHAHMYVGVREFWQDLVKSPNFTPISYIQPNNPHLGKLKMNHYYFFARTECQEENEVAAPYIGYNVPEPKP